MENGLIESQTQGGRSEITAAIRGESEAIRRLWEHHRRWVAAILLAHKPREIELEDLLQDVAMTLVRTIAELRDESAFKPWLRTVSINAARAAGRKASTHRRCFVQSPVPDASDEGRGERSRPDESVSEEAHRLLALAMELPEGYREPLLLRAVRGMSYRAIAHLLGLPETTIETRIARGRRLLRELAEAAERGPMPAEMVRADEQ